MSVDEAKEAILERFKHPVIGVFSIFLMLLNWQYVYIFLFGKDLIDRLERTNHLLGHGLKPFLITIAFATVYTVGYIVVRFFIDVSMEAVNEFQKNLGKKAANITLRYVDKDGLFEANQVLEYERDRAREDIKTLLVHFNEVLDEVKGIESNLLQVDILNAIRTQVGNAHRAHAELKLTPSINKVNSIKTRIGELVKFDTDSDISLSYRP